MRTASCSIVAMVIALAGWTARSQQVQGHGQAPGAAPAPVNDTRTTKQEFEGWMTRLSNWGRWGKDDQLGAANLITPAKRKQAAALVKTGTVVSLSRDVTAPPNVTEPRSATLPAVDQSSPFAHQPILFEQNQYVMEAQEIYFHGTTFTHLDALCHVAYEGKLYNDLVFKKIVTREGGCSSLGVTGLKNGIVTRAVLLDIPRLKGLPYLNPGTHVYREDIEAWEKQAGVRISPGDAVFLRTGRWATADPRRGLSGYDASLAPFLKERDVAIIGADSAQDVGTLPGVSLPIHRFALVALGANILDNLDLESVAQAAARLKRWEFMLMAAPSPVINGSGSAVNPIAVF